MTEYAVTRAEVRQHPSPAPRAAWASRTLPTPVVCIGRRDPTRLTTPLAEGKEVREIDGRTYVLELPIRGDLALVKAHVADRMGNLVYRKTARNFGPVMATAATTVVAQVDRVVETGGLDPEAVVTPSIYVDRVVAP